MKSTIKALGIIALTAVMAFAMAACGEDEEEKDLSQFYMTPPTGIVATKIGNNEVHLTWNAVQGAGHYSISFRTNTDNPDTRRILTYSWGVSVTRYEHSFAYSGIIDVSVNTLYYYIKTHPNKSGYIASEWSAPVSIVIR